MAHAMQPYDVTWLEEPIWRPEDHRSLAEVRKDGIIPIAAGENAGGLLDFRAMFEHGAIDIAQPSVTKIGGITEVRKIIALCDAFGVQVVPHCAYFGPGYLASMHIAASLPQNVAARTAVHGPGSTPVRPYTDPVDGKVKVPQAPGLGCDPDPAVIARYRGARKRPLFAKRLKNLFYAGPSACASHAQKPKSLHLPIT